VLLEFWHTGIPGQRERLNELHKQRFSKGLVVIGVCVEEEAAIKAWCQKNEVAYPIAIITDDEGYDVTTIPDAVLIDPTGKILFRGQPASLDEALIDKAMANARPACYAKGLEEVAKLIGAGDFGKTYALCKQLLEGGKLSEDAAGQAGRICSDAEAAAASLVDQGLAALQAQDVYAAFLAFDRATSRYAGLPRVDEAAAKLAEMQKDAKAKREIAGAQKLVEVTKLEKTREYDKAYKEYKAITSSFAGTKAAKDAAARATALEKAGKLGFVRGCGACEAADAACPAHRKKK
jgi:hypothetical protein